MKVCKICNIEKQLEEFRKQRRQCKACIAKIRSESPKDSSKLYYQKNKVKMYEYTKKYREENREKVNANQNEYIKNKKLTCPKFNLISRLRFRTRSALKVKNIRKTRRTLEYLGCTAEVLQKHIESLFLEGMSWENKHLWHLDHIIPISSGNTEDEILKLNHYKNLQPLWALDNILKSNKIIKPQKEEELCQEQQAAKD